MAKAFHKMNSFIQYHITTSVRVKFLESEMDLSSAGCSEAKALKSILNERLDLTTFPTQDAVIVDIVSSEGSTCSFPNFSTAHNQFGTMHFILNPK